MKRYKRWVLKQAGTAQCSPALGFLGLLVVVSITCYIYREVIIRTLLTVLIAAGALAGTVLAVAITLNAIRWHKRKSAEHASSLIGQAIPDDAEVTITDAKAIGAEADWMAARNTELAFTEEGELVIKGKVES